MQFYGSQKPLPDDIIGNVFVYGMLCGLATAVAVKLRNKYGIAGYMGVTQKKICCPSAAVKLKLSSQIITSKPFYFLLHFNYSQ